MHSFFYLSLESQLTNAKYRYTDAKTLATVASQYIATNGASDPLFISYFKTNDPNTVKGYFDVRAVFVVARCRS